MTYRSASRGILYTGPPSEDENDRDVQLDESTTDESREETPEANVAEDERETPTLDSTTAATDANWTGSIPADD